jgi:hypothetical protein
LSGCERWSLTLRKNTVRVSENMGEENMWNQGGWSDSRLENCVISLLWLIHLLMQNSTAKIRCISVIGGVTCSELILDTQLWLKTVSIWQSLHANNPKHSPLLQCCRKNHNTVNSQLSMCEYLICTLFIYNFLFT